MDEHGTVRLDHQHPGRHRQVGGQPSRVVDLAAGHDESHGREIYLPCWAHGCPRRRRGCRRRRDDGGGPARRARPPGRRAGPRPAAGDDVGRRRRSLVPLRGAAAGAGQRLVRQRRTTRSRGSPPTRRPASGCWPGPRCSRSVRRTRGGPAPSPTWPARRPRRDGTPPGRSPRRWSTCRSTWPGCADGSTSWAAPSPGSRWPSCRSPTDGRGRQLLRTRRSQAGG